MGQAPPCPQGAPRWGSAQGADLNSSKSPDSPRLKNKPSCHPGPESGGPQAPSTEAGEAACRAVSSERALLISMGPQPPCLKIASGALLKMLTLQPTFGRSWQAIKPKLKIGAAGLIVGVGGGHQAAGTGAGRD